MTVATQMFGFQAPAGLELGKEWGIPSRGLMVSASAGEAVDAAFSVIAMNTMQQGLSLDEERYLCLMFQVEESLLAMLPVSKGQSIELGRTECQLPGVVLSRQWAIVGDCEHREDVILTAAESGAIAAINSLYGDKAPSFPEAALTALREHIEDALLLMVPFSSQQKAEIEAQETLLTAAVSLGDRDFFITAA